MSTPQSEHGADSRLSIGQCASLACLLEATAPKPGNVHRGADFEDLTYLDLAASAVMIGPPLEAAAAPGARLGPTVLAAVKATRLAVDTNSNLGTILLMAPLAMVPRDRPLKTGVAAFLGDLDANDARLVYEAIRLARPGGLGRVAEHDVAGRPPDDLLAAMESAKDRDLVARQYANGFAEVLGLLVPWLADGAGRWPLAAAIVRAQLRLMSRLPDTLIARKCGPAVAEQSAALAAGVLAAGEPGGEAYEQALSDFDFWLRSDHHRRNPGTSADLIAAALFAALRDGIIKLPVRFYAPSES
ncbi:MAG: triphosphoribosyl-dephospho-CoA synthase [Pirellulales bacterium]